MIDTDEYYNEEKQCVYKDETYLVRNNGAVLRLPKNSNKVRPLDNKWTFGIQGDKGYSYIAGVQVHRIVATAFHGEAPSSQHIVDHIDTNRQNNRPENLHWVTKLENVLNNPITRKRVIAVCGSIEAFLENPSLLGESALDKNFSWMRRVTPEEANISREKLEEWAKSDTPPSGGTLGQWIYEKQTTFISNNKVENDEEYYVKSLTPNAVQKNWRTPTEFLCCPQKVSDKPLDDYLKNLQIGKILCKHQYGQSEIVKFDISESKNSIVVQCHDAENSVKNWYIVVITYEDGYFVHTSYMSCFTDEGAEKYYTLALGKEWTGGDVFDDFC